MPLLSYGLIIISSVVFLYVPHPCRSRDIGVWFDVMRGMVFVGILTNCAILGFSSEQLMQWLPSLFTRSSADGDQLMALGSGRYVFGNFALIVDVYCMVRCLANGCMYVCTF